MTDSYDLDIMDACVFKDIHGNTKRVVELFPRAYDSGPERAFIPILEAYVSEYQEAVGGMIRDWLKIEELGRPANREERELIQCINDEVNCNWSRFGPRDEVKRIHDVLFFMGFYKYLKTITKHRAWVRNAHRLIKEAGVGIMFNMDSLVEKHDLSKFTYHELWGYMLMYNARKQPWRINKDDSKNFEWMRALTNHNASNPYLPEYHIEEPEGACKEPIRSRFRAVGGYSAEQLLAESVLDMIASNGENQKSKRYLNISKLFNIEPAQLYRYHVEDRKIIEGFLADWKSKTLQFLSTNDNIMRYQKHFDGRTVQL